ncbi:TetR/AcrR family transcriptional regulator [Tessaracoccus sp. G1721]
MKARDGVTPTPQPDPATSPGSSRQNPGRKPRNLRSYATGRARRDAIVRSAAAHFDRHGYHETPVSRIAADVGLTEAGLLYHFPSKTHLLLAVLDTRMDKELAVEGLLPADQDPLRALRVMLRILEQLAAKPGLMELFMLLFAQAADPASPAHEAFSQMYLRTTRNVAAELKTAADAGLVRADLEFERIAQECIAVCDGLQFQWVLLGGDFDLVGGFREYLRRLSPLILVDGVTCDI